MATKSNPFSLTFSRVPRTYIERTQETEEIITAFTDEYSSSQLYLISGVRGSGKSVMMADIEGELREMDEWLVVDLSSAENLLDEFAAALYQDPILQARFIEAKIDISLLNVGLSVERSGPAFSSTVAIDKMLKICGKLKKRILVAIDEASRRPKIKEFALAFSTWMRNGYPVYLIMTGLPEDINQLQKAKNLTFLLRAPKKELKPLNYTMVVSKYQTIFDIPREDAEKMASYVRGYSYAFQLFGYLLFNRRKEDPKAGVESILPEYDSRLAESAYNQIWGDLSEKDRRVCTAMTRTKSEDVSVIREIAGIATPQEMNNYKKRLLLHGVVMESGYGKIRFCLPRFGEFIREQLIEFAESTTR